MENIMIKEPGVATEVGNELPMVLPTIAIKDAVVLSDLTDSLKDEFTKKINLSTEKFFADRGVIVRFNTLGNTLDLVQRYIAETQDTLKEHNQYKSENVKNVCYSKFFDMVQREKLTGFEAFTDLYFSMKAHNHETLVDGQFSPSLPMRPMSKKEYTATGSYSSALIQSLTEIKEPILLYLSGGLDSELVARFMLSAGVPFTPVCFKWLTEDNSVGNLDDIKFAFDFCLDNGLTPIVKEINIPTLWKSAQFAQLTTAVGLTSPQLVTHVNMVQVMAKEYPGHAHLLGGEVRYRSNIALEDGTMANMAVLTKSSAFGGPYSIWSTGPCSTAGVGVATGVRINSDGTWVALSAVGGLSTVVSPTLQTLATGVWLNTALPENSHNRSHIFSYLTNGTPLGMSSAWAVGSFDDGATAWPINQTTNLVSIQNVLFQYNSSGLGPITSHDLGSTTSGGSTTVWIGGGFAKDVGYTGNGAVSNLGTPILFAVGAQVEFTISTSTGPDIYPAAGTFVTGSFVLYSHCGGQVGSTA